MNNHRRARIQKVIDQLHVLDAELQDIRNEQDFECNNLSEFTSKKAIATETAYYLLADASTGFGEVISPLCEIVEGKKTV